MRQLFWIVRDSTKCGLPIGGVYMRKLVNLRELRERAALSQGELARMAGVTKNAVGQLERGEFNPRPATVRKLAEALGVQPMDLWEESADLEKSESGPHSVEEKVVNALAYYITRRAGAYEEDLEDPHSPHFSDPTATALWGTKLTQENLMLCGLVKAVTYALAGPLLAEGRALEAVALIEPITESLEEMLEVAQKSFGRAGEVDFQEVARSNPQAAQSIRDQMDRLEVMQQGLDPQAPRWGQDE